MIILIAKENTTDSPIIFHNDSVMTSFPMGEARASNVKLVSGGMYFHNQGFYHKGREAQFSASLSDAEAWQLRNWHESQDELYFTTNYEHFSARVKSANIEVFPQVFSLEILSLDSDADDIIYPPEYVAPSESWIDLTSNTYWTADTGSWSGSSWVSDGGPVIELTPAGTWASGFDPSKIRVTFTTPVTPIFNLYLGITGFGEIDISSPYTSLAEITLTRGDNIPPTGDISGLDLIVDPPGTIESTKIEFYGIDPT